MLLAWDLSARILESLGGCWTKRLLETLEHAASNVANSERSKEEAVEDEASKEDEAPMNESFVSGRSVHFPH